MTKSIVIPVYNGARTVAQLVDELIEILGGGLQIILVNDGSGDNSDEVCKGICEKYPQVITYLNLSKNFSEHNAVMAGLNYVKGDYVVIMDDDFQNPPEEVPRLFAAAVEGGYDLVYTYYKKKHHNVFRNIGSKFTNIVGSFLLRTPRGLYMSSFKCMSSFLVKEVIKYTGPYPYVDGLALRCTRNIGKIEVKHQKRDRGTSGYTLAKSVNLWLNMFINFSIVPLRVSSYLGLLFSLLGAIVGLGIVVEKILYPEIPMGWPSLVITVVVFSGVQLLIVGLVGEYVGRLFLSTNQTPQYIVREVVESEQ